MANGGDLSPVDFVAESPGYSAGTAVAGAVLTYFGFMHGDAVGIGHGFGVTPSVCLGYLIVAGFLFALSKQPAMVDVPATAVPAE